MDLFMCLKDGGPLCWENTEHTAPMVFESEDDAFDELFGAGDEESIVAKIKPPVIVERLRAGGFREIYYAPDVQDPGIVSLEKFEEAFNPTPEQREKIINQAVEVEVRRMLMKMMSKGEAEYHPETETYRFFPPDEGEGE